MKHALVTNTTGYFEAPLLQPGRYSVTVSVTGFKSVTYNGLVLAVGQQMSLPVTLQLGQLEEHVTVTAETPLLDTGAVSSAQTFDNRMVEISRAFTLGGRRTFQARLDAQNLFNYAAYDNPNTDPTNTNFGRVTTAVGSAGAMRFFSVGARFTF